MLSEKLKKIQQLKKEYMILEDELIEYLNNDEEWDEIRDTLLDNIDKDSNIESIVKILNVIQKGQMKKDKSSSKKHH